VGCGYWFKVLENDDILFYLTGFEICLWYYLLIYKNPFRNEQTKKSKSPFSKSIVLFLVPASFQLFPNK
jgi:hypothetical protein